MKQKKKFRLVFMCRIIFLLILIIPFSSCKKNQMADLIVYNAKVYTVNDSVQTATAFAVKDGKFIAIGSNEKILKKYSSENKMDVKGIFVYPGFFDAHCHFYEFGKGKLELDLVGIKSYKEILKMVKDEVPHRKKGEWILGGGWDQNNWEEKTFPTKDELDKITPDNPVFLSRIDGHAVLVNQKAIELSHISSATKVEGGKIVAHGERPTGILIDNAIDLVSKIIPPISKEQQIKVLLLAQDECLKYGLTTVDDAGLPLEIINRIDSLQQSGQLKIKMFVMISSDKETLSHFGKSGAYKTERLNVSSMKLYADGALGSRGAALIEPYSDDKNNLGLMLNDEKYFEGMLQKAIAMNFQVCTHAIGDRANRFMLNLYGKYLKGKNDLRWRIEHAQIVHPDDWEKFSRYSIIPSVQPTHCTSDMYWVKNRLGESRMKGAYPYKTLLNYAGILPIGSDFPVEEVNPLLGFYAAITRQNTTGFPEGGFYLNERLTREEALKGMTIWSAYANKEEKDKGSIAVGKSADFVILSDDIMTCNERKIPKVKVKFTYVNGERVYQEK